MQALIIGDDLRLRRHLARALESEGLDVEAVDPDPGVELVLEGGHELLVLDLPPGREGLDLMREIHLHRPSLPVLVLSTRGDLASRLAAFEHGAAEYLVKPFSLEELLARVRVHLRRAHGAEGGPVLRFGALSLDVARRQATVAGRMADLPDREFRLLHFMMLHAGEVVSRERLLAEVWGLGAPVRSNVVDAGVRRLRQQLGVSGAIQTVRKVGYRLSA